ncbi:MAG: hypothetical protein SFX73_30010 [Kofleriaceae bacterium]|nr:hypothetical protein [Kofleriaceae bacterium]
MSVPSLLARWPVVVAWTAFALAGVLPLAALLIAPVTLLGATVAAVVLALSALAGFGALFALASRRQLDGPAEAWGLGLGMFLVVGSGLAATDMFTASVQGALLTVGVVLHVIALVMHRARIVAAIADRLQSTDTAGMVVASLIFAITVLHVMGAGMSFFRSPFDDDGNWIAAAQRLRDTGGFGDIIGYPRANQLGGTVVMTGLVATIEEVRSSWLAEGVGFAIAITGLAGIAMTRRGESTLATRMRQGGFVFLILFLALSAKAQAEKELSAFWIPTALVIASYRIIAAPAPWTRVRSIELGLVIGGLATLRLELVPFALALIVVTMRDQRGKLYLGHVLATGGVLLVATLPLEIDRLVEGHPFALRLGKLIPLVMLLAISAFADARGRRLPFVRFAWAAAVGVAATYVGPTVAGAYSRAFSWPLMFGFAFLATAELARAQWAGVAAYRFRQLPAVALVVVGLLSIVRAQDMTIRWNWRERTERWFHGAQLGLAMSSVHGREPYAPLTQLLPSDAAVLVWVDRPELLDFAERTFFDLRVPRHARTLRRFTWDPPEAPLASVRSKTGARYLLLQTDHQRDRRAKDSAFYAVWCSPLRAGGRPNACADPLEHVRLRHRVLASIDNVYLIDLDQPSTAVSAR